MSALIAGLREGHIVRLHTLDGIPSHLFEVDEVFEETISGYSVCGVLKGVYGEPGVELIAEVVWP